MSRSDRIEEIAARWLIHREEPAWSQDDEAELDAWLSQSSAHKVALWRLRDAWAKGDRLAIRRAPAGSTNAAPSHKPWRRLPAVVAGLAAAVLAGILITVWLTPARRDRFETATGVHQIVRLPDGSRIDLNTSTRLRANLESVEREVWLDEGEAFFEVQHDATRPFVIHAGSHRVTVLGTKFSVRRKDDQVRVVVLEGRVRLDEEHDATRWDVLKAGTIAQTADAGVMIRQATPDRIEDDLSWRSGVLVFDQSTLAEAVAEFNRYNRRQLVIADPAVSDIRIGGRLQAHNIDGFTRLLQRTYGLRIEDDGERVTISE